MAVVVYKGQQYLVTLVFGDLARLRNENGVVWAPTNELRTY